MFLDFPHQSPKGYYYECSPKTRDVVNIWICNTMQFNYTDRNPVRSIWGFYNTRTKQYFAPINATKQGNKVNIDNTTPYSAMQRKLNPLELVLYV